MESNDGQETKKKNKKIALPSARIIRRHLATDPCQPRLPRVLRLLEQNKSFFVLPVRVLSSAPLWGKPLADTPKHLPSPSAE